MRKFFNILGKIFAAICAILFAATAVLALVLFNLERRLFNAQTYKQALANQNFYERMPAIMGQTLASSTPLNTCEYNLIACGAGDRSPEENACFENALGVNVYNEIASNQRNPTAEELQRADACLKQYGLDPGSPQGGPPAFISNLGADDWEFIISTILPPEDLKAMTDQALDSIMSFLNNKTDSATLSLAPLKARLNGEAGVALVLKMMEAQPQCTDEQLTAMGLSVLTEGEITMCNPPDEIVELIKPIIQSQLQTVSASIPDEAVLIPAPLPEESDPRGGLITVRLGMRLSPLIPLAFLLGITLFAVRGLNDWLNWWGIPLLVSGALGSLTGLVGASAISLIVQNKMVEGMPPTMPAIVIESGSDLVSAVIRQLVKPVIWQGLALAILGLVMILIAFLQARRQAN